VTDDVPAQSPRAEPVRRNVELDRMPRLFDNKGEAVNQQHIRLIVSAAVTAAEASGSLHGTDET
jgi:hypothetical protein